MNNTQIALIVMAAIVVFGVIIFPIINRIQFNKIPFDQKIRILMKQANKLVYWKNISYGTKGHLVYIKNKRKILVYPWVLVDGKMLCTKANPYECWDYPEEHPPLTDDETDQAIQELNKYNSKSAVKLYLQSKKD